MRPSCAGAESVAACFLPRRQDAPSLAGLHMRDAALVSPTASPVPGPHAHCSAAAREDMFVIHSDGVLIRHRITAAEPAGQPGGGVGSPGSAAGGSSFGSTPDSVLHGGEEQRQGELNVEAEEQWDLCRRRSWAERCGHPCCPHLCCPHRLNCPDPALPQQGVCTMPGPSRAAHILHPV